MLRLPPGELQVYWPQVWDLPTLEKTLLSYGPSSIRLLQSMNIGRVSPWLLSPHNVSFVSKIRASRSNTNFGFAFKPMEPGNGQLLSNMNFVGLEPATMTIWKQILFGIKIHKKFVKETKIWHLLRGIPFWTI